MLVVISDLIESAFKQGKEYVYDHIQGDSDNEDIKDATFDKRREFFARLGTLLKEYNVSMTGINVDGKGMVNIKFNNK